MAFHESMLRGELIEHAGGGGSSSGHRWARWDGEQCTCAFSGSPEGGNPNECVNIFVRLYDYVKHYATQVDYDKKIIIHGG